MPYFLRFPAERIHASASNALSAVGVGLEEDDDDVMDDRGAGVGPVDACESQRHKPYSFEIFISYLEERASCYSSRKFISVLHGLPFPVTL